MTSCRSVEKMVDRGDYESVVEIATKKLRNGKFRKTKHIKALEKAYGKLVRLEMDKLNRLENQNDLVAWERFLELSNRIERRQSLLRPFLPLNSNEGYSAYIETLNTDELRNKAVSSIVDLSYKRGESLFEKFKVNGDKHIVREAFYAFERVADFSPEFKNVSDMIFETEKLGVEHVLIDYARGTNPFIEEHVHFLSRDGYDLYAPNHWVRLHQDEEAREAFDYYARVSLHDVRFSPEFEKERIFVERKEVKDGWDYVLDDNGNVAKDSLGNDIKEPRFVTVKARVKEIFREKRLEIYSSVELYDAQNVLVRNEDVHLESLFEDYTCIVRGDLRALKERTRKNVKDIPLAFPSDFDMMADSREKFHRIVQGKLHELLSIIV